MDENQISVSVTRPQEVDELSPGMRRFVDFLLEDIVDELIKKYYQEGTQCNLQAIASVRN